MLTAMIDLPLPRISFLRFLAYLASSAGLVVLCGGAVVVGRHLLFEAGPAPALGEPLSLDAWLGYLAVALAVALAYRLQAGLVERRRCPELAAGGIGDLALGAAAGIGFAAFVVAALWAGGAYRIAGWRSPAELATPTLMAVGAGVLEEVVMRGFVLGLVARWAGGRAGLIVSAIVFGALHFGNDGAGPWPLVALMLGAGLALGAAYLATGRLWLPIGLHFGWNFGQSGLFGLLDSGTPFPSLIDARVDGSYWLTGGGFGPEASLPGFALWVALAAVLLRAARRRSEASAGVR